MSAGLVRYDSLINDSEASRDLDSLFGPEMDFLNDYCDAPADPTLAQKLAPTELDQAVATLDRLNNAKNHHESAIFTGHAEMDDDDSQLENDFTTLRPLVTPPAPPVVSRGNQPAQYVLATSQVPATTVIPSNSKFGGYALRNNVVVPVIKMKPQPSRAAVQHSHDRQRNESVSSSASTTRGGRQLCQSKQAISAKENREKHKEYVNGLLAEVEELRAQVQRHVEVEAKLNAQLKEQTQKTAFYQNIIQNDSSIGNVLKSIAGSLPSEMKLQVAGMERATADAGAPSPSSMTTRRGAKRSAEVSGSTTGDRVKKARTDDGDASGVCLHVRGSEVTVAFCAECGERSRCVTKAS